MPINSSVIISIVRDSNGTDLGSEVFGRRVLVSVVRRDVNEPVDVIFGSGLYDTLDTVDIDIVVREIPAQLLAIIRTGQSFLVTHLVGY